MAERRGAKPIGVEGSVRKIDEAAVLAILAQVPYLPLALRVGANLALKLKF